MSVLSGLEPKQVFSYFEEICAIPHASYHEEQISNYCVEFAKRHNLTYYQDELKNVIIIKEASPGYENEEPIIIQGHLDMVCEKEPGCTIDFEKDGLSLKVEGDYITAEGTTLGGDDGIAVAYALALLSSDEIAHPKLEVVLTVSEEVGMEGASGIDLSMLEGRRMLNLDSEEEGILLAGCAGGAGVTCSLPVSRIPARGAAAVVRVSGLTGGHSGAEIHKGRANANILMGRILVKLSRHAAYNLSSWEGGKKDNAIPRECTACICIAEEDLPKAEQAAAETMQELSNEYAVTDKNVSVSIERLMQLPGDMLDEESTRQAVLLVNALPNGIQSMSADVENLVETSLNLGILKLEKEEIRLQYSVRSSVGSAKDSLNDKLTYVTTGLGGSVEITGIYPAWEYKRNSALRDKAVSIYEKMYGTKPVVQMIHAGLECGLLSGKLSGLDCISIGPNMQSIHTTEEKLSISSTKRVWDFLIEVLKTK